MFQSVLRIQRRPARASTAGPAGETDLEENGDAEQRRRQDGRAKRLLQPPRPAGDAGLATSRRAARSHGRGLPLTLSKQDSSPFTDIWHVPDSNGVGGSGHPQHDRRGPQAALAGDTTLI